MAYWGDGSDDCDYAFDSMGSYIAFMRDRMFAAAEGAIAEKYPEQTILVTLEALRLLWDRFPKVVACGFRRDDFRKSQELFARWLEAASPDLSGRRKSTLSAESQRVFAACEEMFNG